MHIAYAVVGRPVPQGSMVASYNRRMGVAHVHHVQGAAIAEWRANVRNGAIQAGAVLTTAPVAISIAFAMPRPKAHTMLRYGQRVVRPSFVNHLPTVSPDLDKLVRCVLDALTMVCYYDDAQVVDIHAYKEYGTYTRIWVSDAGRRQIENVGEKNDAAQLAGDTTQGTSPRQLHLPDMPETGGE